MIQNSRRKRPKTPVVKYSASISGNSTKGGRGRVKGARRQFRGENKGKIRGVDGISKGTGSARQRTFCSGVVSAVVSIYPCHHHHLSVVFLRW